MTCCPCGVGPGGWAGGSYGCLISACAGSWRSSCIDLYHVLPSVPVSIIKHTHYMNFGYFCFDVSLSVLYVPYRSHYVWYFSIYHGDFVRDGYVYLIRNIGIGSPSICQASSAGNAGEYRRDVGDAGEFRRDAAEFSQSDHASFLHPGKNPTPPLGGSATLPGYSNGSCE